MFEGFDLGIVDLPDATCGSRTVAPGRPCFCSMGTRGPMLLGIEWPLPSLGIIPSFALT